MNLRIKQLLFSLNLHHLDAFLVTKDVNIRYLTEFPASESWLLVSPRGISYITDFRYILEAKKSLKGITIKRYTHSFSRTLFELASSLKLKKIGFDDRHISLAAFKRIKTACPSKIKLVAVNNLTLRVSKGEFFGFLGPNGAGKSTLVKTLVGELEPFGGERKAHKALKIGYFAQHTVESLREGSSALEHLMDRAAGATTQAMRDFLGTWNFAGDRAFESVDGFSGGERARLALALIAWDKPNLLLLDEPTNHLDLDMREALADALADFDGALVLVSHDRHLLGMVCDSFWRVADGTVEGFDGDLDDYARWLKSRGSANRKAARAQAATPVKVVPEVSTEARRRDSAMRREQKKTSHQRVQRIETRTATIDAELTGLEAKLADPATYHGPTSEMLLLGQRQSELRHEKEVLESEWLELVEQLEVQAAS